MKIENITWKPNVPTKGVDPVKAFHVLEGIKAKNNGLTDDAVVASARPKNHVLHNWFEWDDTEAGIEYRRMQARKLIGSLVVEYKEAPELKVRVYEVANKAPRNVPERTVYSTVEEVLSNQESRDRLIADAIKAAMEFRRRFQHLQELNLIIDAIDNVIRSVGAET